MTNEEQTRIGTRIIFRTSHMDGLGSIVIEEKDIIRKINSEKRYHLQEIDLYYVLQSMFGYDSSGVWKTENKVVGVEKELSIANKRLYNEARAYFERNFLRPSRNNSELEIIDKCPTWESAKWAFPDYPSH